MYLLRSDLTVSSANLEQNLYHMGIKLKIMSQQSRKQTERSKKLRVHFFGKIRIQISMQGHNSKHILYLIYMYFLSYFFSYFLYFFSIFKTILKLFFTYFKPIILKQKIVKK